MSREIKFRAWNKLAHKMATVDALDFMLDAYRAHAGKSSGSGHLADIELMQFTGFVDKHGKDIYEGDIIKHPPYWHDDREVHAVKDIHMFCGDYGNYGDIETEIEVIGNVYETPELLQKAGGA